MPASSNDSHISSPPCTNHCRAGARLFCLCCTRCRGTHLKALCWFMYPDASFSEGGLQMANSRLSCPESRPQPAGSPLTLEVTLPVPQGLPMANAPLIGGAKKHPPASVGSNCGASDAPDSLWVGPRLDLP